MSTHVLPQLFDPFSPVCNSFSRRYIERRCDLLVPYRDYSHPSVVVLQHVMVDTLHLCTILLRFVSP